VPLEWVKELDFDHCELLDKTLAGCAPCQPFSKYTQHLPKSELGFSFRLVTKFNLVMNELQALLDELYITKQNFSAGMTQLNLVTRTTF